MPLSLYLLCLPFQRRGLAQHSRASADEAGKCSVLQVNTTDSSQGRLTKVEHSFDIYRPADRAAGIQVLEFTPVTGDWDWIAFFPVEPDFLVWQRPAMSLRARAKFEQIAGGADEATN